MEFQAIGERLTNGGTCAQDLVARDHHQSQDGDEEDPDPLAPGAEATLLSDGHAEAHAIGQAAPIPEGHDLEFRTHSKHLGVVSEEEAPVRAQLGADIARRDVAQASGSWNGREALRGGGSPLANVDAGLALTPLQREPVLEPSQLGSRVDCPRGEVLSVHILVVENNEGVAEALSQVR